MIEIFKDIVGFEGIYQISNFGRLKSVGNDKQKREKIIKLFANKGGYLQYRLKSNGGCKFYSIHRLVAIHFIPNKDNKTDVNHIDGNKLNNSVENLEWVTKSENINHSFNIGTHPRKIGVLNSNAKLSELDIINIHKEYNKGGISLKGVAKKYGVGRSHIHKIIKGVCWSHVNV